jgi:hypothetical protein
MSATIAHQVFQEIVEIKIPESYGRQSMHKEIGEIAINIGKA